MIYNIINVKAKMKSLSILLPTYNCRSVELVADLHKQCEAMESLNYEIIVADDGSTDKDVVEQNKVISLLSHVSFIIRRINVGRARIRNFLAYQAQYEWLLFIDGDRQLASPHFIENYLRCPATDVVYGGLKVGGNDSILHHNLRYIVEKQYEKTNNAQQRQRHPYRNFNTCNFLVRRTLLLEHPFDERFTHYGYEDVRWGETLANLHIPILHIDNPILLTDYETNPDFVTKTEEGMHTLALFDNELKGYSQVLKTWEKLQSLHLLWLARWIYYVYGKRIKSHLVGNKPSIFWFNIYKLILYTYIKR